MLCRRVIARQAATHRIQVGVTSVEVDEGGADPLATVAVEGMPT